MFELIVASANDSLDEESDNVFTKRIIQDFIRHHGKEFPEQVSYWAELKDCEEFPVAEVLRNIQ
ncbi:hypothetical protein [Blastopirellula marina]|uniref:Uncharacterized protein n=1 Tax=Blastopirellula marina TaxID=124 RepID=A0A2S8F7B9_9BACT|nr:hypothetical protein [Blastopirellula marina]PQO27834.1 hypothetical protein C5Y98_26250 [Blastopirellula marina]PTL41569.1 hypothetical protein C5Y97_26265 [Blastopirellula marina]